MRRRVRLRPNPDLAHKHGSAFKSPVQPAQRPSDPCSAASGFHDSKARHSASEPRLLFESVMIEPHWVDGRAQVAPRPKGRQRSPLISRALPLPDIPANQMVTDK
jgi:hypothetical protein